MLTLSYNSLAHMLDSSNSVFISHFLKNIGFRLNMKFIRLDDFLCYANENFDLKKDQIFESFSTSDLIYKYDLNKQDIINRSNFRPYINLITEKHKPNSFLNAIMISEYKRSELNSSILNQTYSEQLSQAKKVIYEKYSKHYRLASFENTMGNILEFRYYFCYDYYTQVLFDDFDPKEFCSN